MPKHLFRISIFLFFISIGSVNAQPTCTPSNTNTGTPADCTWDLRCEIFTVLDSTINGNPQYYGKNNKPIAGYKDVMYEGDILGDDADRLAAPQACDFEDDCTTDDLESLKYHVWYPKNHDYIAAPLPAVILFHPGGFSDCSIYDLNGMKTLCREFAKRGFIAFTVEYRRGRIKDPSTEGDFTSVQQQLAIYRASQDGRGAIRSIIKAEQQSAANAPFHINLNQIFLGGASAGSVVAINSAYFRDQTMVNKVFPSPAGAQTIEQVLGPINANYYKGASSIDYFPSIKGVLNMWGSLSIPYENRKNPNPFFQSTDPVYNPPCISFHGYRDVVFPYDKTNKQKRYFSIPPDNPDDPLVTNYNAEDRCLLNTTDEYRLEGSAGTADAFTGSSLNLYNMLKSLNPPKLTELYVDCQGKHGLGLSDFGIGTTDETLVNKYIVQRAACFFQLILSESTDERTVTKFTDTENYRFNNCNGSTEDNFDQVPPNTECQ